LERNIKTLRRPGIDPFVFRGKSNEVTESINNRIKRLREAKGFTAIEMAKAIGVPASTYREWEYGRAIRGEPYIKIAEILNISLYELLTGKKQLSLDEKISQIERLLHELRLLMNSNAS